MRQRSSFCRRRMSLCTASQSISVISVILRPAILPRNITNAGGFSPDMLEALRSAERLFLLEYFIIKEGEMFRAD